MKYMYDNPLVCYSSIIFFLSYKKNIGRKEHEIRFIYYLNLIYYPAQLNFAEKEFALLSCS